MTRCSERLAAGAPLRLPSGQVMVVIECTRTVVRVERGGGWAFVQRAPHALLLRAADGTVCALATGPDPVSPGALSQAVPHWDAVLSALRSAVAR